MTTAVQTIRPGGYPVDFPASAAPGSGMVLTHANEADRLAGILSWQQASEFDPAANQTITGQWAFQHETTFDGGAHVRGDLRLASGVSIKEENSNAAKIGWAGSTFRNCIGVSTSNLLAARSMESDDQTPGKRRVQMASQMQRSRRARLLSTVH